MSSLKFLRHIVLRTWEFLYPQADLISKTSCDIVLVCHEKDYLSAKLVLKSISFNILNPINNIFFISNLKKPPVWLNSDIKYVYEGDIPGVDIASGLLQGCTYRGWVLQQIIKYSATIFSEKYVVIDCDTVLLKPHLFFDSEATVLRLSYEHSPHYRAFEKSLRVSSAGFFSYTCHMMPYKSEVLSLLKNQIENLTGMNWIVYFCKFAIDHGMVVNEQDLYAKFLISENFPVIYRPWFNKTVPCQPGVSYQALKKRFSHRYSISLHNNQDRQLIIK
jgi:hypothetical protein